MVIKHKVIFSTNSVYSRENALKFDSLYEPTLMIIAGLSEIGIELVDWLISRGANKIILQSQYRPVTGYQCLAIRRWKNDHVNVILSNADISVLAGAESLINAAAEQGSVGGIFHVGYVCYLLFLFRIG